MTEDAGPKDESDGYAATELAHTERAGDVTQDRPRAADRSASPQPRVIGRFRIEAQLGSGGMGDVYRAHDPVLDRPVALKVLHTGGAADGTQGMRRVLREARAAAALTHPNTVTIFEVGEADGEVFIAMELLEGEDLRAVLERGDASLDDKLRWLLEAARALQAAHTRGLVHRDVKPENMFVCKGGTLKLLDFGIAKRHDDEDATGAALHGMGPSSLRTEIGRRVGTPRYMAPEQHAGEATDERTDEYAWGLVAFELLTGAHPGTDLPTMTRDGGGAPANATDAGHRLAELRARAPHVAEPVAATVARALQPMKEDRFPTMAPIIEALASKPAAAPATGPAISVPAAIAAEPAPPRSRRVVAMVLALAVGTGAVALARDRARPRALAHEVTAAAVPEAACHVESTRVVPIAAVDRMAVLPDGHVVLAKNARDGILLERVGPDGDVPIMRHPHLAGLKFAAEEEIELRGTRFEDANALAVRVMQGERGDFFAIHGESRSWVNQRFFGPITGLAFAPLGKDLLVMTTTAAIRSMGLAAGVEVHRLTSRGADHHSVEQLLEGAVAPALAVSGDRIAAAYVAASGMRFALLDHALGRLGDVHEVSRASAHPAIAFAGSSAIVFWTDAGAGKTRLHMAVLTPGEARFSPAKIAVDEPLAPKPPVTARLPNGEWAVAWVASTGGVSTLRVSAVGAGGALSGPSDIARGPAVESLRATSTDKGITYSWYESAGVVRIADVTCSAPSPRK